MLWASLPWLLQSWRSIFPAWLQHISRNLDQFRKDSGLIAQISNLFLFFEKISVSRLKVILNLRDTNISLSYASHSFVWFSMPFLTAKQQLPMVRTFCTGITIYIRQPVTSKKPDTKSDQNKIIHPGFTNLVVHFPAIFASICFVSTYSDPSLTSHFVESWHSLRSLRSDSKLSKCLRSCLPRK